MKKVSIGVIVLLGIIIINLITRKGTQYNSNTNLGNPVSELHNTEGLHHLEIGNYDKAIVEFEKALEGKNISNEDRVRFLRHIRLVYHELGDYKTASDYARKALKYCTPNSYDFYVQQGDLNLLLRQTDSAIISFEKALEIDSIKLEANNSMGLILLGDYGQQYKDLQKALVYNIKVNDINQDNITKNVLARNYYLLNDYEKAEEIFRDIVKDNDNDLNSKYSLALICYYTGKHEEAKKLFKEVFAVDNSFAEGLGSILDELNLN